jgi:hypothetical protein
MRLIDKEATLDVKIQAHSLMGQANDKLGRRGADREYGKVVGSWKDPAKAAAAILEIEGESQSAKQRRLGKALTAVGEAMFYFAEKKRAKLEALKFPAYKGSGSMAEVNKHIQTKVKKWIGQKNPLITDATLEYKKIVDLQPVPSPQWVIAAGSRVGRMWGQFVDEFRGAPIPSKMKKDVVIRTAYYGALDEASEPWKLRAKGAFATCLDYSVKFQYFDEFSRSCEKWLAENYKAEFHLVDEFKGDPNRVNRVLAERPYPLQLGGEPVLTVPQQDTPADDKPEDDKSADDRSEDNKAKQDSKKTASN